MRHAFLLFVAVMTVAGAALAGDRFVVRDGRTAATVERYLWTDRFVIRDRDGRTRGTIEPSPWGDDYLLRDREGRTRGIVPSPRWAPDH